MVTLRKAESGDDIATARRLFLEYRDTPGVGVCVVSFDEEVASLPGAYTVILLAEVDSKTIGCGALRERNGEAEMKRLYVRPEDRGTGAGRALATALIEEARRAGYGLVRLDTLPSMAAAIALYESMGFTRTAPYYEGAPSESLFYELRLR